MTKTRLIKKLAKTLNSFVTFLFDINMTCLEYSKVVCEVGLWRHCVGYNWFGGISMRTGWALRAFPEVTWRPCGSFSLDLFLLCFSVKFATISHKTPRVLAAVAFKINHLTSGPRFILKGQTGRCDIYFLYLDSRCIYAVLLPPPLFRREKNVIRYLASQLWPRISAQTPNFGLTRWIGHFPRTVKVSDGKNSEEFFERNFYQRNSLE